MLHFDGVLNELTFLPVWLVYTWDLMAHGIFISNWTFKILNLYWKLLLLLFLLNNLMIAWVLWKCWTVTSSKDNCDNKYTKQVLILNK